MPSRTELPRLRRESRASTYSIKISSKEQLPPALTTWIGANLGVECSSVRALALQRPADLEIFQPHALSAPW
jgi:hypothetical protein